MLPGDSSQTDEPSEFLTPSLRNPSQWSEEFNSSVTSRNLSESWQSGSGPSDGWTDFALGLEASPDWSLDFQSFQSNPSAEPSFVPTEWGSPQTSLDSNRSIEPASLWATEEEGFDDRLSESQGHRTPDLSLEFQNFRSDPPVYLNPRCQKSLFTDQLEDSTPLASSQSLQESSKKFMRIQEFHLPIRLADKIYGDAPIYRLENEELLPKVIVLLRPQGRYDAPSHHSTIEVFGPSGVDLNWQAFVGSQIGVLVSHTFRGTGQPSHGTGKASHFPGIPKSGDVFGVLVFRPKAIQSFYA